MSMRHYTNQKGYNGIRSQPIWIFKASQPPANHPYGAYFTTLSPETPHLARRLLIPRSKVAYSFPFHDAGDLNRLDGDRGKFVFYSPIDYVVVEVRQLPEGPTGL